MQEVPEFKEQQICGTCHMAMPASAYFCSNCGKPLKEKPPSTTLVEQMKIYLLSFFLPPVGFWYGWKYMKQPDRVSQRVGAMAVILTFVSIILAVWATQALVNAVNQSMTSDLNSLGF